MNRPTPDGEETILSANETLLPFSQAGPKPTHIVIVGGVSVIIAIGALISAVVVYTCTGGTVPFDYGIVVDAGSTHTQALLYEWQGSKHNGTGEVVQQAECTYPGGIASLLNPAVIVECVVNVTKQIPNTSKSSSPLYLAATAGMRLLNLTDPDIVRLILLELKCELKSTGVDVREVKVISGFDEGLYSWITVNFLNKTLYPKHYQQVIHNNNYSDGTVGSLDMGGASTQVAFVINQMPVQNSSTTNLKLYGHEYSVFSTSFLCFGANEAHNRHQALLIENLNTSNHVFDPCLPKGNITIVNAKKLLGGPCTITKKFKEWLQIESNQRKNFVFEGTSDYKECEHRVKNLINTTLCEEKGFTVCPEKVRMPKTNMKFMAFSSFYYVTNFLNATKASLTEFRNITKDWCKLSWQDISHHSFSPKIFSHLVQYCFGASFITNWLTSILNFDENSWRNVEFQEKISNTEVGWALGMMINATNAVPAEKPTPPFLSNVVFVIILLCCVFIGIVGVLLMQQYCREKFMMSGFSRLRR